MKRLDQVAAEVLRQNYAIEVEVRGEDETGRLAQTLNTMCVSGIGHLSGSILHDLRNPLAAIYGAAEMLVDADLPAAHVKRLAGNIYRASCPSGDSRIPVYLCASAGKVCATPLRSSHSSV